MPPFPPSFAQRLPPPETAVLSNGVRLATRSLPGLGSHALGLFFGTSTQLPAMHSAGLFRLVGTLLLRPDRLHGGATLGEHLDRLGGRIAADVSPVGLTVRCWVPAAQSLALHMLLETVLEDLDLEPDELRQAVAALTTSETDPHKPAWDAAKSEAMQGVGRAGSNPGMPGHTPVPQVVPSLESVQAAWKHLLCGSRLAVVAAGDVQHEPFVERWNWLESLPAEVEGTLPASGVTAETDAPPKAPPGTVAWAWPAAALSGDHYWAGRIAHQVAVAGRSSRVQMALVRQGAPPARAHFEELGESSIAGLTTFWQGQDDRVTGTVEGTVEGTLDALAESAPTSMEVETARAYYRTRLLMESSEPLRMLDRLGQECLLLGRCRDDAELRGGIDDANDDAVHAAFRGGWERRARVE